MNKRIDQWIICIFFCGFLFTMLGLYMLLPKESFSQQEKRYLAESPVLNMETLSSGSFSDSVDAYMADHIPGRNFFVGLKAYYDLFSGRQVDKEVYFVQNERIVEAPTQVKEEVIIKNMKIINTFSEKNNTELDLMIVPSSGWAVQESGVDLPLQYQDEELIQTIYDYAGENVRPIDVLSIFKQTGEPEALYYKTDHHWNSLGAYTAYQTYLQLQNKAYLRCEDYQIEEISGFYGSTYSRSALWLTPSEALELWHSENHILVEHENSAMQQQGVFFRNRLQESDKYTVFLDGNHSIVRLENLDNAGNGRLLVIRDSFSNCLGGFLADSYEEIILVDLRYYREPVSELLADNQFDQILICYSIGNFLTDTNLIWLR